MEKAAVIIKNCSYLNENYEIIDNQSIVISGNTIRDIGPHSQISEAYQADETINGQGKLAVPGFIDGHIHTCQQLLKGRTADEYPMVWARILVPFESNLTEKDTYISGQLSALEMIKSGTTGFAESGGHHMAGVIRAIQESGMRGMIARSVMDQGGFVPDNMKDSSPEESIRKTEELYREYHGTANGRISIWFGIRQVITCSSELIAMTVAKAKELNTGIHCHLAEHRDEVSYCLQNFQKRVAEYLESLACLGPNLIAAHSVLLSDAEIDLLADYGVGAVHCPKSNLTSHGFPKTPTLLHRGVNVALGSDGAAGGKMDLFQEMKLLRSAIGAYYGIPIFDPVSLPAKKLLKMVTQGGAQAIGLKDRLGSLTAGNLADISLINIDQPHLYPTNNLINTLVDVANGNDVWDVIIDGKVVMRDREVLTLDEERIMYEAGKSLHEIRQRANI